jgi:AcrR family transcriptional regulator
MSVELAGCPAAASEKLGLRERQRQARGEAILQAAFTLIVEDGYEALTMEGLAERVGISRQTLYHHFASKEEITLRAILTLMERGLQTIEAIDPDVAPIERLRRVVRWLLESRFQPATAAFVKARHSLMPLKAHPDYKRAFEQRAAALARMVEAAQSAGELRADLPSALIVQMLLGLVSEPSYESLIAAGTASHAAVTDAVLDVFFQGLRP